MPRAGDPNQEGQSYGFTAIGRLKAGVTLDQAGDDLMRAHQPIFDARDKERIVTPFARDLRTQFVTDFTTAASTLLVAVALLLAVACANVTSVMLAHAIARRREMGIRVAIGATRVRLLRPLLVENLLLALVGGIAGVALGQATVRLLVASLPDALPPWLQVGLDVRVLMFAVLVSTATVFLFRWAPALHAVRGDLRAAMNSAANAQVASTAGRFTLRVLVGAEFAMAAVLIVCGGLLARAYDRVRQVDPRFRADGALTFRVALPQGSVQGRRRTARVLGTVPRAHGTHTGGRRRGTRDPALPMRPSWVGQRRWLSPPPWRQTGGPRAVRHASTLCRSSGPINPDSRI